MSSKFGAPTQPYKPPAVCHKPPLGPGWDVPPFDNGEWEGYCDAFNANSPSEGGMSASIKLVKPSPPADWFGTATAGDYRIDLYMNNTADPLFFDYHLEFYFNDTLDTLFTALNRRARSISPFDSGLIYPTPRDVNRHAAFQLWL